MSLMIDVDKVTDVLLADGWHKVHNASFFLDAYEFAHATEQQRTAGDFTVLHGGGENNVCATGFCFEEEVYSQGGDAKTGTRFVYGPLTSILAVRGDSL